MRAVIVVLTIFFLTGCYSTRWYKANATDQDYYQDNYACTQEAQQQNSSAYVNAYGGAAQSGAATNWPLYKQCMYARGYRESQAQAMTGSEETRPFPTIPACTQTAMDSGAPSKDVAAARCQCLIEHLPSPTAMTKSEFDNAVRVCKAEDEQDGARFIQRYGSRLQ